MHESIFLKVANRICVRKEVWSIIHFSPPMLYAHAKQDMMWLPLDNKVVLHLSYTSIQRITVWSEERDSQINWIDFDKSSWSFHSLMIFQFCFLWDGLKKSIKIASGFFVNTKRQKDPVTNDLIISFNASTQSQPFNQTCKTIVLKIQIPPFHLSECHNIDIDSFHGVISRKWWDSFPSISLALIDI